MADRIITLRDGRRIGLTAFGDPAVDRIVVLCHPAPGASGFDPDPALTSSWGVHVVAIDRPGYGASDPLPDDVRPTIPRFADDIAEYIEHVVEHAGESGRAPLHRIGVIGWSAGGRVALALAARHPGLVDRVAVVATPAPDSAVRWVPHEYTSMTQELLRQPLPDAKRRLRSMLESQLTGGRPSVGLVSPGRVDDALLDRPGLRGRLERMLQAAYAQGAAGVVDDILSYAEDDWGFSFADVRAPVLLVYGAKDPVVPSAHGRWYRRRLPDARLTVVPRSGHLVVVPGWERILRHVDPQHGSRSDV